MHTNNIIVTIATEINHVHLCNIPLQDHLADPSTNLTLPLLFRMAHYVTGQLLRHPDFSNCQVNGYIRNILLEPCGKVKKYLASQVPQNSQ